jgi:hypothetical protein
MRAFVAVLAMSLTVGALAAPSAAEIDRVVSPSVRVGEEASAGPGDAMYFEDIVIRDLTRTTTRVLSVTRDAEVARGETLRPGTALQWHMPMGKAVAPKDAIPNLEAYCSPRHIRSASPLAVSLGGSGWKAFICLQDPKKIGQFTHVFMRGYKRLDRFQSVPYAEEEKVLTSVASVKNFKAELLYQGAAGGVLRMAYREFTDDMIRASFTQDVTFQLEPDGAPTDIRFKGARMTVLEASNNEIRFKLNSPFSWD